MVGSKAKAAIVVGVLWLVLAPGTAAAQSALAGDTIRIAKAAGPIAIDGTLDDEGWRTATRVEKWYEVNPGDNRSPASRASGI